MKANAVFWGAVLSEAVVLGIHFLDTPDWLEMGFLWYNVVGCGLVVATGYLLQAVFARGARA